MSGHLHRTEVRILTSSYADQSEWDASKGIRQECKRLRKRARRRYGRLAVASEADALNRRQIDGMVEEFADEKEAIRALFGGL